MEYLNVCINSLLKFNNNLENLILYPNKLEGEDEKKAMELQKILNRNAPFIIDEANRKIKNFNKFKKEESAFLIVFIGDMTFSTDYKISDWHTLIENSSYIRDKELLKKIISMLI